jgi:hypothetical protein
MPSKVHLPKYACMGALAATLSACSTAQVTQPFTTDGCSMFPDHSLVSKADWCSCCVAHDLAYWRGGTAEERLKADQELQHCVQHATGNKALGELMFAGVRTGGGSIRRAFLKGIATSKNCAARPVTQVAAAAPGGQ